MPARAGSPLPEPLRIVLRTARDARQRLRFRLWTARFDLELRRCGGKLIVEAPYGASFDSPPFVRSMPTGRGDGTFTLRLGRDVHLGRHTSIDVWARGTNLLELGSETRFLRGVRLQLTSGTIQIGARGDIRDGVVLKSSGLLSLGEQVSISYGSVVHCSERVEVEDLAGVAEHATLMDSDHAADGSDDHFYAQPLRVAPVHLARNVFVAAGATVLRGSRIGRNSVIAANAVLPGGHYAASSLIAGTPAKAIKVLARAPRQGACEVKPPAPGDAERP